MQAWLFAGGVAHDAGAVPTSGFEVHDLGRRHEENRRAGNPATIGVEPDDREHVHFSGVPAGEPVDLHVVRAGRHFDSSFHLRRFGELVGVIEILHFDPEGVALAAKLKIVTAQGNGGVIKVA
jgi:hypothetical protein